MISRHHKPRTAIVFAVLVLTITGCASTNLSGTFPKGGALIPDTQLHILPGFTLSVEQLIYWGGVAAVAYYVTDPLAPNWSITEAKFPGDHYRLSLQMKRYYVGGAGEARAVFNRRANNLVLKGGYEGYQILDYSEGLESSVIGSQRVAEGTIVLMGQPATQGSAAPARSTAPSTENPRS